MDYIETEINNIISSFKQLPYLFVGTGMSIRYADAPNWDQLLFVIWKTLNPEKEDKDYIRLKQGTENENRNENNDISLDELKYYINPIIATKMQEKFHKQYYYDPNFHVKIFSNEEDNEILEKKLDPFKYFVAKQINTVCLDEQKADYPEIKELIKNQNKFAGIITTNYDNILERLFPEFSVLIGQDNMLLSNSFNIFEIFKIHGCATTPNSMIITAEDYEKFRSRLKYLSAKLLTIFVEHPIIFIGYGLGDINIRELFSEIADCLNNEQLEKIKENFIFITPSFDGNESIGTREIVFGKNVIAMKEIVLKDYSTLYKALSNIQSSLPIKLARKLQNMVCEYVYSATAVNNIIFGSLDSPQIDDDMAAIYFGNIDTVHQIGFSHYTIDDILEDVLFNNKPYLENEQLITKTFKNIRSSAGNTLLPIYKYVSAIGYDISKIPETYYVIKTYDDIKPTQSEKKLIRKSCDFSTISEIEKEYPNHIAKQVACIKKFASKISTEELENYLKKHFKTKQYCLHNSKFKRLIALYDFKKYK